MLPHQVNDLINTTLKNWKKKEWTDNSLELTEYVTARLLKSKGAKERGGTSLAWVVQVRNGENARNTGLHAQDQKTIEDLTVNAEVPWSMQTTNWSWDVREAAFQTDRETIVDILKMREHAALNSLVELNETNFFTLPINGSKHMGPCSLPYWFVKNPTANPEGGFHGGNPAGFPGGAGGIDSVTYPHWRNYTAGYVSVSQNDLIRKIKKAFVATNFVAPNPHPTLGYSEVDRELLTNYRVLEPLERFAESRNENLGSDVAKFQHQVIVAGVPTRNVPYLEHNDSTDPVYGVDWSVFRPFFQRGQNTNHSKPCKGANQHNSRTVHIDTTMNYENVNRRKGFVICK